MIWIAIALAGGTGAAARFTLDHAITAWIRHTQRTQVQYGTVVVNVSGSLLAGIVTTAVAQAWLPASLGTVVAGGFLGGYTTFSTAMVEVVRAAEGGEHRRALGQLVLPLIASVAAAALGVALVMQLS